MPHVLTVIGLGMEVLGSGFLSYDLLKSKSAEEELSEFRHLQSEIENGSQQMIVNMNSGLWMLANLLGNYLAVLELDFEKTHPASPTASALATDPTMANLAEKGRVAAVSGLIDAKKFLPSPDAVQSALGLISRARQEIESRFTRQVDVSRRLRRIAILGVLLVGIGGICEFVDLVLFPERPLVEQAVSPQPAPSSQVAPPSTKP